ncbi:MAG TPA: metal ABC transporter ATP-binding protein [Smithella sp.]|nr:metal ABC transporter ATP-binding protein [Smithella sp.]
MSEDIISINNLTFCYNGLETISDISFTVKKGDYLGIAGPNGSGKSTLIKNILGILQAQKGTINIFGRPLASFNQWNRIGYLPQRINALNSHFPSTVEEIVQLGVTKRNPIALKRTLELMGVAHLSTRLIGELSYGEQQRIMLARALISQPDLLIFDEPTTALDPETRDIFYSVTDGMNRKNGTTIVLVTHDTGIIGQYARNLLYLDKKLIFFGTFENFCASPDMAGIFGLTSQHVICHQHERPENSI